MLYDKLVDEIDLVSLGLEDRNSIRDYANDIFKRISPQSRKKRKDSSASSSS